MTTVKFRLDPANPPRFTPEELAYLDAMTDEEIEANALSDPDNPPMTDAELERGVWGRRVRLLRQRLGLAQAEFAERYGVPAQTIREWEEGRHKPEEAVVAYITVIEREPEAVERALRAA